MHEYLANPGKFEKKKKFYYFVPKEPIVRKK